MRDEVPKKIEKVDNKEELQRIAKDKLVEDFFAPPQTDLFLVTRKRS